MFERLMARIGDDESPAIRTAGGVVSRAGLARQVAQVSAAVGRLGAPESVWVAARAPYATVVAVLGALRTSTVAPVDPDTPPDALAAVAPPGLVLVDDAGSPVARWARAIGCPLWTIGSPGGGRLPPTVDGVALRFWTSGTTGAPKHVDIGVDPLLAALAGVARRIALTPDDTALGIAPLNHVLGLVTSVLVPLASGGSVAFAEPRRPRELFGTLEAARPTWCPASPGAHALVHRLVGAAGRPWPGLRLLRTASAPIPPRLLAALADTYGVPVVSAYAMTEAPGEIASEGVDHDRRPGTVGKPTLCEVQVRGDDGPLPAGVPGDLWVRGPNVATGPDWIPTGDIGTLDADGFLWLRGRRTDVINHGGLKIWPPDVESVALADPAVHTAVAFPIPHESLGQTVGLAVVPRDGRVVDRAALRRRLMSALPRHAWPRAIVVCAEIPLSPRGKLRRTRLWEQLSPVDS